MREKKEGEREKRKGEGKRGENRKNHNLEVVELLLSRGSEINGKNDSGRTPLHFGAANDWTDDVAFLLKQTDVEVNPRDVNGQTPLHLACSRGHLHIVELLLGHNGIDGNVVGNNGDTPLHEAVKGRKYKVVSVMLNKTKRFHSEVEPLSILDKFCEELKLGNEERYSGVVVASYLAHHGANFYCKNKIGRTPLDLIEKENLKKMLKTLFSPHHGGGRRMDQTLKGPIRCVFCEDEVATETFFPCKHLSLCKKCCPQRYLNDAYV
ncbi:E3 ubiquitin-protein ligase MIB2-like isoform X3 [Octopus vulgaris]|uniref:E3 ubiquitin-protein ligase MIB2-like isoform X3 n=1 Tax=Octopus vulgaris TaxID=6645 RepID=A0AA36MJ51_OCTVU|nr:E3 ubiquitin-protein ligase MIB2-like isoform X3 [Octopus vulgaris]